MPISVIKCQNHLAFREIEALEPVIATVESQAKPGARIRFRYDWRRQDLERIRAGIQEHIDAPRREPSSSRPR
jgi:RAQPRD family integrative conjugative element protein